MLGNTVCKETTWPLQTITADKAEVLVDRATVVAVVAVVALQSFL
jgi:hypothetical protein